MASSPNRPNEARTSAPPRSARCGHLRDDSVKAFACTSSWSVATRMPEFCGNEVPEEGRTALAQLYSGDAATGFKRGDLRGALWVEVPSK